MPFVYCALNYTIQRTSNRHQRPCSIEYKHLARSPKYTPFHLCRDLIV